jgi:signal transduction histidine kinase
VVSDILRPWRGLRVWPRLAYLFLGVLVGAVTFSVILTLLATTASLVIVFPIALPFAWLMFVSARGFGRLERSRAAALLDVDIPDPHAPLRPGSWWAHLKQRIGSGSRWREIAYLLLLLPLSGLSFAVAALVWCGSFVLIGLPFYADHLPGGTAKFHWFEIGAGAGAWLLAVVGVVGVVLIAPWVTMGLAAIHAATARGLLGPARRDEMSAAVTRLEASRVAAVDSAEAERRRIERDLHDGAQQRMVSLAMDLGLARERFDTDPAAARELVVGAHEEAKAALTDLRDLVRGIHPAILADRGLDAALSAVVARSSVPVALTVDVAPRPSAAVESTAYFVVSEALANVDKHAHATRASVSIVRRGDRLVVDVSDDGGGGADETRGTGLHGLSERVTALGGWMHLISPPGGPTTLLVEMPCGS